MLAQRGAGDDEGATAAKVPPSIVWPRPQLETRRGSRGEVMPGQSSGSAQRRNSATSPRPTLLSPPPSKTNVVSKQKVEEALKHRLTTAEEEAAEVRDKVATKQAQLEALMQRLAETTHVAISPTKSRATSSPRSPPTTVSMSSPERTPVTVAALPATAPVLSGAPPKPPPSGSFSFAPPDQASTPETSTAEVSAEMLEERDLLRRKLADAESRLRRVDREQSSLRNQLESALVRVEGLEKSRDEQLAVQPPFVELSSPQSASSNNGSPTGRQRLGGEVAAALGGAVADEDAQALQRKLANARDKLEGEAAALQLQLGDLQASVNETEQQLTSENSWLRRQLVGAEVERDVLRRHVADLEERLQSEQDSGVHGQIDHDLRDMDVWQKTAEQLASSLSQLRKVEMQLEDERQQLRRKLRDTEVRLTNERDAVRGKIQVVSKQVQAIETESREIATQVATLEAQAAEEKAIADSLARDRDDLANLRGQVALTKETLDRRLTEAEMAHHTLWKRCVDAEARRMKQQQGQEKGRLSTALSGNGAAPGNGAQSADEAERLGSARVPPDRERADSQGTPRRQSGLFVRQLNSLQGPPKRPSTTSASPGLSGSLRASDGNTPRNSFLRGIATQQ